MLWDEVKKWTASFEDPYRNKAGATSAQAKKPEQGIEI